MKSTIYCIYRVYYWFAFCIFDGKTYEPSLHTHGSARQASDEIVSQIEKDREICVQLRRTSAKRYEMTAESKGGSCPDIPMQEA